MPIRMLKGEPIGDSWLLLHQTYDSLIKCEEDTFYKFGLPLQQYLVLRVLKYAPKPVTLTVVANWLDRNHNSISLIVDRMGRAGFLKRVKDLKDRRSIRLVITPKGDELYRQLERPADELPKKVLSVLSQKELITLIRLLQKIRENTFEVRNIKDKVININL
jgi:DNA-binding MarR family transcriptional regulator